MCVRACVCVPVCVRAYAYVVSRPPPQTLKCQDLRCMRTHVCASKCWLHDERHQQRQQKRLAGTAACKSANDCRASCPFLPPPVSASLLAGDLKMLLSECTNCRCADAATQLQQLQQNCNRAATAAEVQIIERVHQLPVCRCSNQ